jgi:alpha-ketoglutaric semialdehyde dehydrogenase
MDLHGKSFLAGQTGAIGGATYRAINPATGESLAPDFHEARSDEVESALRAASAAFEDYRTRPPETRARLLETIATEIEALGEALLQRAQLETGLPLARLQGERARTCGQLRLFAQVVREGSWVDARIDLALPERQPAPRPDLRRMLVALGPVVVFGSSNFPLAFSVAGGDTASALAAGCPVLVKAHRAHPGTAELVAGAVIRAVAALGLPAGLFSLVHGAGESIGVMLVKHPLVAAVGFTGSLAAGRALCDAAAARPHPIPVFAEMSSVNPVILLPGALRERGAAIAQGLLASVTLGVGQFCTKPGLVFALAGPETDAFLATFTEAVQGAPCATMLTPGIRANFLQNQRRITGLPDVSLLASSRTTADANKNEGRLCVAVTTAANFLPQPLLATEAFGPFALIITAETTAELTACVRALDGQLTATLHGDATDFQSATPLVALLEQKAGRLVINGFPTGVEVSPAMNHGGPYPATSDTRFTSVGTAAILRFARPVCYQGFPDALLPPALQQSNPLGLLRLVNGAPTREGGV